MYEGYKENKMMCYFEFNRGIDLMYKKVINIKYDN